MRRLLVALLLLAPLAALGVHAASPETLFVNVVSARSLGCSPDVVTQPDLRVRVLVNDAVVLETAEARDLDAPLYANLTHVTVELPARVAVEVEEAEPGGFLGLGAPEWRACDAAPGAARRFTATADGSTQRLVAMGDGSDAAEAVVVVGRDAPAAPALRLVNATATDASLAWSGDAAATAHRLALAGAGGVLAATGPGNGTAAWSGLCDNAAYAARVVRDAQPWSVASPDLAFRTPNAAPAPARMLGAEASGGALDVSWESAATHDAQAYEVHAGPNATFEPGNGTLRAVTSPLGGGPAFEQRGVALKAGDSHVRVRTVDTGGLSSTSEALAFGATQPATLTTRVDCARGGPVTAASAPPPAAPPRPTPPTPPPTTNATRNATANATTNATTTLPTTTTPPTFAPSTTPPTTLGSAASEDDAGGGIGWPYVVAIALGAAALGGVAVLALRR